MSLKNLVAITILVGLCSAAHGQFYKIPVYNPDTTITNFKNADLNHDGNPDLLAVSNGSVVSMLGDGHGGFGSPKLSTISGLNSVGVLFAASDFNNDGFVDVAVHGTDPVTGVSAVGVMLGNGDGTFKTTKVFALGSGGGYLPIAGDFNGDGDQDIAVVNGGNVSVLLGEGNGKFRKPVISPVQNGQCAATGDFNGDGNLDLAVGSGVLLGNGDGTFQQLIPITFGGCDVAASDLNHDGKLDLITGRLGTSGNARVFFGDGTGHFNLSSTYNTAGYLLVVDDFNKDGFADFASLNGNSQDIGIFLNNGDGTFRSAGLLNAAPSGLVSGDFNSDGTQDIVIGGFSRGHLAGVSVLLGLGDGTFKAFLASNHIPAGQSVAADLNGDKFADVVTPRGVLLGSSKGLASEPIALPSGCDGPTTVGDFNHDGKTDIAGPGLNFSGVVVCLGKGNGKFGNPQVYDSNIGHHLVLAGDFNNDGVLDLAASDVGGISILLGKKTGGFKAGIGTGLNGSYPTFILGDFNGDGKLDIAAVAGQTAVILLGKGNGTFKAPIEVGSFTNLAAADLNNDGKLDLLAFQKTTLSVLLGKGDGTFNAPVNYTGDPVAAIAIADFNGDGKLDVAVRSYVLQVRYGNGDGTLRKPVSYSIGASPGKAVLTADVNGDGKPDAIVPVWGSYKKIVTLININ